MRRFGLIAGMLVLASCTDTTAPLNDLSAIAVAVRVEPQTIVAGQPASITLTLTNTRPWPVVISQCPIYFAVKNESGTVVGGSESIACLLTSLVYQPLEFGRRESKTLAFQWLGSQTQDVPAGVYRVFGWANNPEHASPAAQITVLSAN